MIKSGNYAKQSEIAEHLQCQVPWVSKLIKKCVIQGYLEEGEWFKFVKIAKQKRALDKMNETDLKNLKV